MNKKMLALVLAALMSVSTTVVAFAEPVADSVVSSTESDETVAPEEKVVVSTFEDLKKKVEAGEKTIYVSKALNITESIDCKGAELILDDELKSGAFLLVSSNCTISNATINTNGKAKHGVQFYCVKGSGLSGVVVKGGYYTSVIVNGAENITITDCELYPEDGAYANIEFAMGKNVDTKPSVSVSDVKFGNSNAPEAYVDGDTLERMGVADATAQEIANAIEVEGAKVHVLPKVTGDEEQKLIVIDENGKVEYEGAADEYHPEADEEETEKRDNGGDYFGNEKWGKVKREIAAAEEGDTIKVSATGLPWFPSSVARALKGHDITLEIRKNGTTYSVNGEKIGAIEKIWYEFDQLEEKLLTAEAK